MPIRPEMRSRYPRDWPAHRAAALERSGHRCAFCRKPNQRTVLTADGGTWLDDGLALWRDREGNAVAAPLGERRKLVRVVLTTAHLRDHDPANCASDNLASLCQYCHLRLDHGLHMRNAAATRRRRATGT